jgi:flagellar export protein FliJ
MKRFRFPLQAVMTIRVNAEAKALEAFAQAQTEVQKIQLRQQAIQREIAGGFGTRTEWLHKSVSSEEIQKLQQGIRMLQEAMRRCQAELQKAQAVLEAKKKILLETRQQREIIDKLYDKQLANHNAQIAQTEQRLLDDFATMRSMGNVALKWK